MSFLSRLFWPSVYPMNIIRINKKNILANFDYLQSLQPEAAIFPVLKSNAYWHWLKQITKILNRTEAEYLIVDSYPEYLIVKKYSRKPILLLWETLLENYRNFDFKKVTFCVYNLHTLKYLWETEKDIKIHIFLNTWMNREWIDEENLTKFLDLLKHLPNIQVTWIMSHLHSADEYWTDSITRQSELFKKMYYEVLKYWHAPLRRHIGNTAWLLKIKDDFFNAYRPWLWLYGYNPLASSDTESKIWNKLKPALSITSRIVGLHNVGYNEWVSYNLTWKNYDTTQRIAVVPFGYAEWLSRNTSDKIYFRIWRKYFRQVWTICMNLCSCQIDHSTKIWDEIEIISESSESKNSMKNLADQSQTIVYENLVRLDKNIRRETI